MLLTALLIWIRHRRELRACGVSFAQFLREEMPRIEQILRARPGLVPAGTIKSGENGAEWFDRRDLRARW